MGRLAATSPGAGKTGCAWPRGGGKRESKHSAPSAHCTQHPALIATTQCVAENPALIAPIWCKAEHPVLIAPIQHGVEHPLRPSDVGLSSQHPLHPAWGWGLSVAPSLHPSGAVPAPKCQSPRLHLWVLGAFPHRQPPLQQHLAGLSTFLPSQPHRLPQPMPGAAPRGQAGLALCQRVLLGCPGWTGGTVVGRGQPGAQLSLPACHHPAAATKFLGCLWADVAPRAMVLAPAIVAPALAMASCPASGRTSLFPPWNVAFPLCAGHTGAGHGRAGGALSLGATGTNKPSPRQRVFVRWPRQRGPSSCDACDAAVLSQSSPRLPRPIPAHSKPQQAARLVPPGHCLPPLSPGTVQQRCWWCRSRLSVPTADLCGRAGTGWCPLPTACAVPAADVWPWSLATQGFGDPPQVPRPWGTHWPAVPCGSAPRAQAGCPRR